MYRVITATLLVCIACLPDIITGGPARAAGALPSGNLADLQVAISPGRPGAGGRLSLDVERGEPGGDWDGLKRDTFYFGFTQLGVIGLLYASPQSVSGWSPDKKDEFNFEKYKSNIRKVVWDSDDWWINYLLHPYWGGAYYVRASERGYGEAPAFWYSVLLSTMYEFGAEALFEEPSVQDLIFTPGLGYFVGKYFMGVRDGIRMRVWTGGALTGGDKAKLFLTDPLGSVNRGINALLGWDVQVSVQPVLTVSAPRSDTEGFARDPAYGPARGGSVVSGVQVRVTW